MEWSDVGIFATGAIGFEDPGSFQNFRHMNC